MNGTAARFLRLGVSLSGLLVLGWVLTGQAAKPARHGIPLPTDWSHSHVIFSRPATAEQVALVSEDPRYWQQRHRREDLVTSVEGADPTPGILDAASSATNGAWSEDLGAGGVPGAGNYPAKFSFSTTTANCSTDYVVYSTGLVGSGTQASVVAFNNLYSSCGGTVPSIYWAYNTSGLGSGKILTSPVISRDGSQVAFVQTNGAGAGTLVLIRWKASITDTISSPSAPNLVSNASYRTCPTLPCMTTITLRDQSGTTTDDTTSSVFYDYTGDIGWVGGAVGWLHKITGMFLGTPAEVKVVGGFPVQVNAGNTLSNPVYDHASQNVFVGDAGGIFYAVNSATAAVTKSAQLDFGTGLVASPILDQTNGLLYVFASSDGTANCAAGTVACSAVYILPTTFGPGATGTKQTVGTSVAYGTLPNPNPLYLGAFDSTYYDSVGGTGNLYVCGDTGVNPILYRVPISSGAFSTSALAVAALTPATKNPSCSPVSDFSNPNAIGGPAERLFFSVALNGHPTACANKGCVMNFVDTPWQPKTTYAQGQLVLVRRSNNTLWMNVAIVGGTTGASAPAWTNTASSQVTDGTVTWLNQGAPSVVPLAAWAATHAYALHAKILDSNGNVEIATVMTGVGTSGALTPSWSTSAGSMLTDGTEIWVNAGAWPNAAVASASGAGGVIIDNSNALTGASQVYFFTLGNQLCITSTGTGACAMQASQSTLK